MRVIPRPWLLVNPGLAPNLSSRPRGDGCGGPTKLISDSSNPARNGPTRRPTRGSAGPRVGPRPPLSRRGCGWLRNPVQRSQRLGPGRTLTNIEAWTDGSGGCGDHRRMVMRIDLASHKSLEQVRAFLERAWALPCPSQDRLGQRDCSKRPPPADRDRRPCPIRAALLPNTTAGRIQIALTAPAEAPRQASLPHQRTSRVSALQPISKHFSVKTLREKTPAYCRNNVGVNVRRGKAFSSSGCEPRATTVAPVGSSQGGSWRQRNGLKHSGVKGPR